MPRSSGCTRPRSHPRSKTRSNAWHHRIGGRPGRLRARRSGDNLGTSFIIYSIGALLVYALVSRRLDSTPISGPIVFVALGMVGYASGALPPVALADTSVNVLLELTLALLLFTDASKIHLRSWEADMALSTRLLAIGMPLTIVLGTIAAYLLFPSAGIVGAAIIATILAPTDAALGTAVVQNPRVPIRIREALGIESGLNDGIALPILLFLITLAKAEEGVSLWGLFVEGIGVGILVGVATGAGMALAIGYAMKRSWIERQWVRISVVAVAFGTFIVADHLGGSGFIAAYVAGNSFGRVLDRSGSPPEGSEGLAEDLGTVLTMTSFLIFGAYLLAPNLAAFTITTVVYAALSLTVVRMVPVAVAMIGEHAKWPTITYLGWFGPRGLASIIFTGVLVEEAGLEDAQLIVGVVIVTVALSVLLHGTTAPSGADKYAKWHKAQSEMADETAGDE